MWRMHHPFEKYARQNRWFPQVSEHKRNETTTKNLQQSWATLLLTIMEVEHGYLEDQFVSEGTLFHFYDRQATKWS